jgi:hypothetical protein
MKINKRINIFENLLSSNHSATDLWENTPMKKLGSPYKSMQVEIFSDI